MTILPLKYLRHELFEGDKFSLLKLFKFLLLNPNKRFLFTLRIYLNSDLNKVYFVRGKAYRSMINRFGCFINPNVKIGLDVKFPHPNGIIIGGNTSIGKKCIIYQQVTFGGRVVGDAQKMNYPSLGDNVTVYAGAKIIGNIKIGDNAVIGANSVVNKDVPSRTVFAGVPAKFIKDIK